MVELDNKILKEIRKQLEYIAKNKKDPIPYEILAERVGLKDIPNWFHIIGEYLGDISEEEVKVYKRPMLSVLVVNAAEGIPSDGFFNFAWELGRWDGKGSKNRFFEKELKEVRKTWHKKSVSIINNKHAKGAIK